MNNVKVNFVEANRAYSLQDKILDKKQQDLVLWKDDYKYVEVFVSAQENVELDISLCAEKGIQVQAFMLESTLAFIGSAGYKAENPFNIMPRGPKEKAYDIVAPFKKFNLIKGESKCLLFKVIANKQATSSKAKINILANDEVEELTVNVEVLDREFIKPKDYSFKVEYWQHPFNSSDYYKVKPFSREHLEILKQHQLLYKELGGEGVICTILDEVWGGQTYSPNKIKYPSMVEWCYSKNKGWSFDYTILDKWISANIEWGLDDKFICYSMMPWGNVMRYHDLDKNKYIKRKISTRQLNKYKEAWGVFLKDFIKHLDEKGWFDKVYIGFDERNDMKQVLDLVESYKNKDGKALKISASFNNYLGNKACLDRIDSAAVGLYEVHAHEKEYKQIVNERRSLGKKTLLYTATDHYPNSFALSIPAESYWSIMYSLASGNDGFLRWAYDAWVRDPLIDATHFSFQAGDCFLIYPAYDGNVPCMSFRLVELDQGVRDANKLNILRKEGKNAVCIDKMLAKVWKDYTYKVKYSPFWGPCIHKNLLADENARELICMDEKSMRSFVDDLSKQNLNQKQ